MRFIGSLAAASLVLVVTPAARADVDWLNEFRQITYSEGTWATTYGLTQGYADHYTTRQFTGPGDFSHWSYYDVNYGQDTTFASFDGANYLSGTVKIVTGMAGFGTGIYTTRGTIGRNLIEAAFRTTGPVAFTYTRQGGGALLESIVRLDQQDGAAGFNLVQTTTGVLDAGTWKFTADTPSAFGSFGGAIYSFDLAIVPEPGTASIVFLCALLYFAKREGRGQAISRGNF